MRPPALSMQSGKGVSDIAVGDAVSVIPSFSMNQYHTYGEVILLPSYAVVKHPTSLSFAEAASVWMMFVNAYGALIEDAKLTKGDFVLIPAASSSAGLAAVQVANYAGRYHDRVDAQLGEETAAPCRWGRARHRHGRGRSGRGSDEDHRWQGARASPSIRSAVRTSRS